MMQIMLFACLCASPVCVEPVTFTMNTTFVRQSKERLDIRIDAQILVILPDREAPGSGE